MMRGSVSASSRGVVVVVVVVVVSSLALAVRGDVISALAGGLDDSGNEKGVPLSQQLREKFPEMNDPEYIRRMINNREAGKDGKKGKDGKPVGGGYEGRVGKKRHTKEMPIMAIVRTLYGYVQADSVLQMLAGLFAVVLVAYALVVRQDSWQAADIEEKREARKARVQALRAKRHAAENVEEPKAPPKPEPKPGVRLSSKEVFEIIAQRKAKAEAKAKVQGPRGRAIKGAPPPTKRKVSPVARVPLKGAALGSDLVSELGGKKGKG